MADPADEIETLTLALEKAEAKAERWRRAYERLEAKLANARIKLKALSGALENER